MLTVYRNWVEEPDGPNDRQIEIWWNNNWVPAYFSDIRSGDFYLLLDTKLDEGRCFLAKSDVLKSPYRGVVSFIVPNGVEIVQAPSIKDVEIPTIEADNFLKLTKD
jgi:hypothetical protein